MKTTPLTWTDSSPDTAHERDNEDNTSEMASLRRKIDRRLLPIMFLCYLLNFIDKVSLNYAAVMGLNADLKLEANEFSNAATSFFAAYLIAELPTAYILNKVSAAKWLGINVMLWGIATACTAAATNYATLLAARIFLGIFEAATVPCLILVSSQWYTKAEQAPRFAFWYCGLGCGQIIGGLLSFGFQHVTNSRFQGWKMMFVVLGSLTVVLGVATFFFLPDSPLSARFLTEAEKRKVSEKIYRDSTNVITTVFSWRQLRDALTDPQLLLLGLMTVLPSMTSGIITTYSATLIRNFGYSTKAAALLNMPSGAVAIIITLVVGNGIRRTSRRWAWFVGVCLPGVLGSALMCFLPASNKAGLLVGIYLVNFIVPTVVIAFQYAAANTCGQTKRVFSSTLVSFCFGLGNIISPQTFQARDAPQYLPAKITVLVTQASGAVLAVVLYGYYRWQNSRRDKARSAAPEGHRSEVENLTDRENRDFRYVK